MKNEVQQASLGDCKVEDIVSSSSDSGDASSSNNDQIEEVKEITISKKTGGQQSTIGRYSGQSKRRDRYSVSKAPGHRLSQHNPSARRRKTDVGA